MTNHRQKRRQKKVTMKKHEVKKLGEKCGLNAEQMTEGAFELVYQALISQSLISIDRCRELIRNAGHAKEGTSCKESKAYWDGVIHALEDEIEKSNQNIQAYIHHD